MEDLDQYLTYVGGPAGALALTGVAAASAFYLASRPQPEAPLVPLDSQCVEFKNESSLVSLNHVDQLESCIVYDLQYFHEFARFILMNFAI